MFELSRRDKKMLMAGGIFLLLFSVLEFVYFPSQDRMEALKKRSFALDSDIEQMEALRKTYQKHAQQFDRQKMSLKKRNKLFSLFSFLDSLSEKSGVKKNIAYMKPFSQDVDDSDYRLSRVTVKLQQVYLKGLIDFLFRIETSSNTVFVTSLSLTKIGDKEGLLDAVIETQTLVLKGGPDNQT